MRAFLDRVWVIGRRSERAYLRFYPNPGFMVRAFGREFKGSRFYGWSVKRT